MMTPTSLQGRFDFLTESAMMRRGFTESALPFPQKPDREAALPRPNEGYIGLQNHSKKDIVFFKEVAVRVLK